MADLTLEDVNEVISKLTKSGLQTVTLNDIGTFQSIDLEKLIKMKRELEAEASSSDGYSQSAQIIFE